VAPLVAAAIAAGATRARRPALAAAGLAIATVAAGAGVAAIAESANYFARDFTIQGVPYGLLGNQAASAFVVLQQLYAGNPASVIGATTAYLGAIVAIGARAAIPGLLRRRKGESQSPSPEEVPPTLGPPGEETGSRPLAATVWAAFWGVAALAHIGAFMLSSQSVVGGEVVARYLYGLPLVIAALVAIVGHRRLALAAATLLALGTSVNFLTDGPIREPREHGPALAKILATARANDVTRGYASSYFTAYPLERASRFALRLSPVGACAGGPGLCPMYLHRLDGVFVPQPGVRSFLLVDGSQYAIAGDRNWVTEPVPGVKPLRSVDVGDGLTMVVYDHDIAADLGPAPGLAE